MSACNFPIMLYFNLNVTQCFMLFKKARNWHVWCKQSHQVEELLLWLFIIIFFSSRTDLVSNKRLIYIIKRELLLVTAANSVDFHVHWSTCVHVISYLIIPMSTTSTSLWRLWNQSINQIHSIIHFEENLINWQHKFITKFKIVAKFIISSKIVANVIWY